MIAWLLKTLEKNPASVFRKKDLIKKSKEQFEELMTQRFLTYVQPDPDHETYPCTLPCSNGCPMDVVNMEGKQFAICPEDTEIDPIPLTKDDISRYHLSLKMLIEAIRGTNDFTGDTYSLNPRLHFIGERIIEGVDTAFIIALFPNIEAAEPHLLSLPNRIAANYRQVVVVTPNLGLTQEPIYAKLRNASIFPVTLGPSFGRQDFKINYLDALQKSMLSETSVKEKPHYVFRKQGDKWVVAFEHGETLYMDDLKGMGYIARLLAGPNRPIAACDLSTNYVAHGVHSDKIDIEADGLAIDTSIQSLADNDALKDCYKRLRAIPAEIDQAKQDHDQAGLEKLQKEKADILEYVRNSTGLGKNPKAFEGDIDKARKSVSKAITTAIAKFKKDNSTLFSHLTNSITLGTNCIYSPETLPDWIL